MKKWYFLPMVCVMICALSISVFAYESNIVLRNWGANLQVKIDGVISSPTIGSDTTSEETGRRRLRYSATRDVTARGRADNFQLSLTNAGVNISDFTNSYATIRIIMEVYPQNENSIAGNFLDTCIAGAPSIVVHYGSNNTTESTGETTVEKKRYNASTEYFEVTTDYKFFMQSGESVIDGIAIYPNISINMKDELTSKPTLRTYFSIFPLVVNTGGKPLTGNDLSEILHVDIDIDMTPVDEETEQRQRVHGTVQEYRDSLRGKTVEQELTLTRGEYLRLALLQNKALLEYMNDSIVFNWLIHWAILIGLIGVAFGVGTWLRRR